MRAGLAVVLGVCAAVAGGCGGPLHRGRAGLPAPVTVARSLAPAIPTDGPLVESVLVERPAGDPLLCTDLWAATVPAGTGETRALLAENGIRAGVLGGGGPQRFQALLESDADVVSPLQMTFNNRKESVVPTAGPLDSCKFTVLPDLAGKPKPVELKQARCGWLVRPAAADGRVKLWCEPQLQHGERREWFRPNEDGTELIRYDEIPLEKYPELGFEAALAPDDYLVVGWTGEQPGTLGEVLFTAEANGRPRQRLLVIRARKPDPGGTDLPPIAGPGRRR